jgi:hypothetical protein
VKIFSPGTKAKALEYVPIFTTTGAAADGKRAGGSQPVGGKRPDGSREAGKPAEEKAAEPVNANPLREKETGAVNAAKLREAGLKPFVKTAGTEPAGKKAGVPPGPRSGANPGFPNFLLRNAWPTTRKSTAMDRLPVNGRAVGGPKANGLMPAANRLRADEPVSASGDPRIAAAATKSRQAGKAVP